MSEILQYGNNYFHYVPPEAEDIEKEDEEMVDKASVESSNEICDVCKNLQKQEHFEIACASVSQ